MKPIRNTLLAAVMTVLAACQGPATGPKNQGQALFSVKGQMVLGGNTTAPSAPIRLAVAWYPDDASSSAPRALVTQDVQYQGTFPLNYTFSFFGVPPADALNDYTANGVTTRAAFGVLMAYEDVNGNGQLDGIASGGSAVDRVLGSSLGDVYNGNPVADPVYVAYVDGTPPPEWTGYGPGYNLQKSGAVVPATTAVPIPLDQTNELNFLVCDEFISGTSRGYDLPCNIAPTDGVRVIGNVYRADGVGGISLRVTDGTHPLTTAQVEVNGAPVSYDPASGLYTGVGVPVFAPGRNEVRVTVAGQPARVFQMQAPDDFTVRAPPQRVLAGTPVDLQWQRAAGAWFYSVGGNRITPPYDTVEAPLVYDFGQSSLGTQLTGLTADDGYQLQVVAFAHQYLARGRGGSMVNVSTLRSQYVDVIAANAGLRLEGTVTLVDFGGQTSGSAWMSAFDGITELTSANVTVNGDAMSYDSTYKLFGLDTANLVAGQAATLLVAGNGKAAVAVSVPMPGDFTVQALPASQSGARALALSWSASAGATDYRVWATDAAGDQLFFEQTLGTSLTLPALNRTGDIYVSVAAAQNSGNRHVVGLVQKTLMLTLTP